MHIPFWLQLYTGDRTDRVQEYHSYTMLATSRPQLWDPVRKSESQPGAGLTDQSCETVSSVLPPGPVRSKMTIFAKELGHHDKQRMLASLSFEVFHTAILILTAARYKQGAVRDDTALFFHFLQITAHSSKFCTQPNQRLCLLQYSDRSVPASPGSRPHVLAFLTPNHFLRMDDRGVTIWKTVAGRPMEY